MFKIEMQVRDYECDIQGIVNNSVYNNYFEHCRHQLLHHYELDFHDLTKSGIILVVYRAEVDYKIPLKYNDIFNVNTEIEVISKVKCLFNQSITIDNTIYAKAKFFITGINSEKKIIKLDEVYKKLL